MKCKFLLSIGFTLSFLLGTMPSFAQTTTITVLPGDTVCANTPVRFRATTTDTLAHRYKWQLNGVIVGSTNATYTTTTLVTNDTVWAVLTNVAGDTILDTSNYIVMTVNPNVRPSIITGTANICLGSSETLLDSVSGGVWYSNNTAVLTVSSTGAVTPVTPGNASVYYKITTGSCKDSVRIRMRVEVPASPIATPGTICIDSFFLMADSARGGLWSAADTTIASLAFPFGVFQGLSAGTTTISYNLVNSCGTFNETSAITVINCDTPIGVSVKNVSAHLSALNIYPNPSTGSFAITYNTNDQQPAEAVITNLLGQQVAHITLAANKESIWQSGLASGVYFITLHSNDITTTEKIIINR